MKHKTLTLRYLAKSLSVVIGLVLVWRGVWYILDAIDLWFFGNNHFWTAIAGIAIGILVLWLPDHDLKEMEKL